MRGALFYLLFLLALAAQTVSAHTSSTAYLEVKADEHTTAALRWRVALRDLDALLDLDANSDQRLTWGEVTDRSADIVALAGRSFVARADNAGGTACATNFSPPSFARLDDTGYAVLAGQVRCAERAISVHLTYRFLEGIDPSHRVLLIAPHSTSPRTAAPGGGTAIAFAGAGTAAAASDAGFGTMFADGVGHILGGFDHLLFLVALMLPAVLERRDRRWHARAELRAALLQVVWIATAFTVAHSITLALASFGVVRVPSDIIEPLIAFTVLLAALNNLTPVVTRSLAWVAFGFGLIHGFGFASVLAPLELPAGALALALLAFNLGVETGQLAVVAVAFAALAGLRRWNGYPRWVLGAGSAMVVLVAGGWIIERAFEVPVFATFWG